MKQLFAFASVGNAKLPTWRRKLTTSTVAIIALAMSWSSSAHAVVISTNSYVTVASTTNLPTAANLGTAGYDFSGSSVYTGFQWSSGGPATVLPTFVTSISATGNTGGSQNTTMDVGGTSYTTGEEAWSDASGTLISIKLAGTASTTVPAFQIGLLEDTSNTGNITTYLVTDTTSGGSATTTEADLAGTPKNDFYLLDITGALGGDTITVYGTKNSGYANAAVDGITFDVLAPEPATLSLMTVAAIGLLTRRRRTSR